MLRQISATGVPPGAIPAPQPSRRLVPDRRTRRSQGRRRLDASPSRVIRPNHASAPAPLPYNPHSAVTRGLVQRDCSRNRYVPSLHRPRSSCPRLREQPFTLGGLDVGTTYYVHALNDLWVELLRAEAQSLPLGEASRHPSVRQVRSALSSVDGLIVEEHRDGAHWSATVRAPKSGTRTRVLASGVDEDQPQPIHFEGGDPELMIEILERLAHECGVLVLRAETSLRPLASG